MSKTIGLTLAIIVGALLFLSMIAKPAVNDEQTIVNELKDVTVALVTPVKKPGVKLYRPYCAGVWISRNEFITAYHCVKDDVNVDYISRDAWKPTGYDDRVGAADGAHVIFVDPTKDLALVLSDSDVKDHAIARFDKQQKIQVGDKVHIVGHTAGIWWTYSTGVISNKWEHAAGPGRVDCAALQISAPVWMGNSGGGAFDEHGNLIGIMSWMITDPNVPFFISHEELLSIIHD